MRFGLLFFALAAALLYAAFLWEPVGWVLLWPAVSVGLVSSAYLGLGPGVFGKRPDGTVNPAPRVFLLPYLLYAWGLWQVLRLVRREAPFHTLAPGITGGRWLRAREMPVAVEAVLDLTCEFHEPARIVAEKDYVNFPILDGSAPPVDRLVGLLRDMKDRTDDLYIHCAEGHGRTGLVSAALLVARGLAPDAETAVARIRDVRPGVRLRPEQWKVLREACRRTAGSP
jgi:protein-tyrosine phosphatase